MKDPRKKHRCNCNSKELRKTHYTLGRDYWDPLTQYKHDYPPKPINAKANIDNQKLRVSHLKLGDDINPYLTSTMEQNKFIENADRCNTALDENAKNDLRKNHFVLGHYKPNFETTFRTEFYDKSALLPKDNLDSKNIEKMLRAHNYEFGDDKPDYVSEAAYRFTKPLINPNEENKNKITSRFLQQSNFVFGGDHGPWNTTQKRSYTPKLSDFRKVSKNLMKTNFVFGDDKPPLNSTNKEVYIEHPYQFKPVDKEYLDYLRKHHYQFGKADLPNELLTQHRVDYQNPSLLGDVSQPVLGGNLRQTHWQMGDATPAEMYNTTYNIVHTPKKADKDKGIRREPSVQINGNNPMTYLTDYTDNYIPMKTDNDSNNVYNKMIGNIRNAHFQFGEDKNDFSTTAGNSYKYNPDKAKNANSGLGKDLLDELKATHYKLGYDNDVGITTQKKDYIPFGIIDNKKRKGDTGNNFNLGDKYNNKFEGETIYTTDYVQKEIPDNGNDCWC